MSTDTDSISPQPLSIPSDSKEKRQFWKEEVRRWKASGKKQSVYSKERDLLPSRLNYWARKLGQSNKPSKSSSGKLVSIGIKEERQAQCIRIKRINGTWIELPLLQDMTQLKALLEVLGC
ncbi:MAG: hypothetical protein GY782_02890 [Gammaproteobacteria bacterium]|nr:hypothetical protein [Gammaproteobacteria bacterium]